MSRSFLGLLLVLVLASTAPADAPPPEQAPVVRILTPLGGQTRERIVQISGQAIGVPAERLTLVLNGVVLPLPHSGGQFSTTQVLAPGWNEIRVVSGEGATRLEDSVAVFARVPRKDLRITIEWDTDRTDVDLWVTGPDGEKVYYQSKQGAAGGSLDTDVTNGFGPETYTQARLMPGTYRVQAHFYGEGPPTRVRVTMIEREGTPDERRREFRGILLRKDDIFEVTQVVSGG